MSQQAFHQQTGRSGRAKDVLALSKRIGNEHQLVRCGKNRALPPRIASSQERAYAAFPIASEPKAVIPSRKPSRKALKSYISLGSPKAYSRSPIAICANLSESFKPSCLLLAKMPDETSTQRITRSSTFAKAAIEPRDSMRPRKSSQLSLSARRSIDGADDTVAAAIKSPQYLNPQVWRRIWWVVGI
ncbi:hypothetical protein NA57DRAFT_55660 [Rhizodiscina lignyota]|uniref:Uncharacterized protein n=1 Tax=Rhizodiscina lignyota TaxID=1504668 RepID=A0A9P4M783_9PEZI|nr:hypothetical protein NA57DRAFT_55660 [Rhizodiscina lignyota]